MTSRRIVALLLLIGLAASLFTAIRRERHERAARTVEIVMDDADFTSLARSYAYDQTAFLVALRRAGLTSLAVAEELGGAVSSSPAAAVYSGATLAGQARLVPLADPLFRDLAAHGGLRGDEMYLVAYDAPTALRYAQQLRLKFSPRAVRRLRAALPSVWAIRTQSDYFATVGLGLPADRVALAQTLGLLLVPRLQNDERFTPPAIDALLASATRGSRVRTVVFFGLRNQVLGFPNAVAATADDLARDRVNFGTIETYDAKQTQAGNDSLARLVPEHLVRVQAIAKPEQDKLSAPEIVARYLLGVRERNIRVVYLRPFAHQWDDRSILATNVEIVHRIAQGVRDAGLRVGGASSFSRFADEPLAIGLASLAVPGIVLWLLLALGVAEARAIRWVAVIVALDLVLLALGFVIHRDLLVRKLLAFSAGLAFPTAGIVAIAWAFRGEAGPGALRNVYARGVLAVLIATGVTLAGALVVIGLLSTPLTMTEIERFSGVKYVLVLPAAIGLALYFATDIFGARIDLARAGEAPVRVAQLVVAGVLLVGAYVLLARSGNQSDIAPSTFELSLRSHLTTILQVRPRFKEFVVGFPAIMVLVALAAADRRRWGWLFVLAIGVGLGDVIDTFSHLHTALAIGAIRIANGALLGVVIGAIVVALVLRFRRVAAA